MDALEAFSQIVGLWPNSFKPRETWRQIAMDELDAWTPDDRANVIRTLQTLMRKSKVVDIETLRAARFKSPVKRSSVGQNTEAAFLERLGLTDTYSRQHIGDRVMISRLIRTVMHNPGWEGVLEEQAGNPNDFQPWERIENLVRAADGAMFPTSGGKGRKACYPKQHGDGQAWWEAPTGPVVVHLPRPRVRNDMEADRAGVAMIFAIAKKYGGFRVTGLSAVYESPEYQDYLKDYTDRTGLEPG